MMAMVETIMAFSSLSAATIEVDVTVDTSRLIGRTRPEYVSFNLDTSYQRDFFNRDLRNPSLLSLARDLGAEGPSFLRIGGTGAKSLFYQIGPFANVTFNGSNPAWWRPGLHGGPQYLNATQWDRVCHLAAALNARIVFNTNLMQLDHDGGANLRALLEYSVAHKCPIFGIEPTNEEALPTVANLKTLWKTVSAVYPGSDRPGIIGPDGTKRQGPQAGTELRVLAKQAGVPLLAANYHSYGPGDPFAPPTNHSSALSGIGNSSDYWLGEMWIGESAQHVVACSCCSWQCDSFAASLWYLHHLGRLAQLNHRVFLRQDLVGGFYGVVRDRFWYPDLADGDRVTPNSDYFLALLTKRAFGEGVLDVAVRNATATSAAGAAVEAAGAAVEAAGAAVEAAAAEGQSVPPPLFCYAHCARNHAGGIAVAIINYKNSSASANVAFPGISSSSERLEYVLTAAAAPIEQGVALNGAKLSTGAELKPHHSVGKSIALPPLSLTFLIFPSANVGQGLCELR